MKVYGPKYKEANYSKIQARQKSLRLQQRADVLNHYGGICACCGEQEQKFLAIDHINGNGNKHRKSLGVSSIKPSWFVHNKFPIGFQVLCHNCNMAKSIYGKCPHKF